MKRILLGALCIAGAVLLAASCGNSSKKAERKAAEAAAEQARLDSLEQVEMQQKQKEAMATIATLPDEPVFDIVTNMGMPTSSVPAVRDTPSRPSSFPNIPTRRAPWPRHAAATPPTR